MRTDRKSMKRGISRRPGTDREGYRRVVKQSANWNIQVLESRVLLTSAVNLEAASNQSPQIVGEISADSQVSAAAAVRSAGPIGVTATPNNNGTMAISWKAVSGASSYNIYRGVAQGQ